MVAEIGKAYNEHGLDGNETNNGGTTSLQSSDHLCGIVSKSLCAIQTLGNHFPYEIDNFVESVYLRIREIKFKEKFPIKENLYPGEYIKDIAKKIIDEDENRDFKDLEDDFDFLSQKSLNLSMEYIKSDLSKLKIELLSNCLQSILGSVIVLISLATSPGILPAPAV